MAKMHNPKIWDLFGKGTEHDEIRDLFVEFVEKLDERLADGDAKKVMMVELQTASDYAHRAIADMYPTIKDLNPLPKRTPGVFLDKETMTQLPQPEEILNKNSSNKVSEFDAKDIEYKDYRIPFPPEAPTTKASALDAPETRIDIQKD